MTGKSCWQALTMVEHERENDKGYKGPLGPKKNNSIRKLISLCLEQNENKLLTNCNCHKT